MSKVATISIQAVFDYYGSVKADVFLSDERREHIKDHHPEDFEAYSDYIAAAIQDPDEILDDHRHERTALFLKRIEGTGINVVVRLMLDEETGRSFVVTMHAAGQRSTEKLEKRYRSIYKSDRS